jgi:subtilisin family serine protease
MISRNIYRGLIFPALFFAITMSALLAFPACTAAGPVSEDPEVRILLGFKQAPSPENLSALRQLLDQSLSSNSMLQDAELVLPNVAKIRLAKAQDSQYLEESLRSLPFVAFVEHDGIVKASFEPNDPRYPEQWHLPTVSTPQAWDLTTGSGEVTIAVIDTGVDSNHVDLAAKLVAGYNFVARNNNPLDDNGHGTHVAGIAAASSNNSTGVAGVDWNARIMPLKVLDAQGSGYDSDVAAAICYAADHGAKVINMSLGGSDYSYTMAEAVNYAFNQGATIVAAAGNDGSSVSYPGALDHVIAVGALNTDSNVAYFSNRGSALDLTAPGVSILSTVPGGYQKMSGTSMASPLVAGCASLLLSVNPSWSPSQVEEALKSGATDLGNPGFDPVFGYGKVNVYASLSGAQPGPDPNPYIPEPGDGTWNPPSPGGESVWYLAEGYTGEAFQTYVLIQNPNVETASLQAEYVNSQGNYLVEHYTLAGHSRLTLNLNAILPASEVSTCISSINQVGVVVERSMYFDAGGRADGHCTQGSPEVSTSWYFAEGYTGPGFDEYILVLNPYFTGNYVQLTLFDNRGDQSNHEYWIPPASRLTIHVNDLAPARDVAARVTSTRGVVAERAMYFDYAGREGGHCSMGMPSPSTSWFFAEGYTGPGFDEWLLLFNPTDSDRTATITYRFSDGGQTVANYIVDSLSRYSVHVNNVAPDRDVAIMVECGGEGLLAERAMYFDYRGAWDGGHCSEGARRPSLMWNLAEGYTGGGFETWILIQNTSPFEAAEIRMATMGTAGMASTRVCRIAPGSRTTIYLNDLAAPGDASVSLYSTNNVPVIAERSMYFTLREVNGGSVSMGCPGGS